jgi:hypothetical protein
MEPRGPVCRPVITDCRIGITLLRRDTDPDLQQSEKSDPDPYQSEKSQPDPHQSEKSDPNPHQSEKSDPDRHQGDADPKPCKFEGFIS